MIIDWLKEKTYKYRLLKAIKTYNSKNEDKMVMVQNVATFQKMRGENNSIIIGDGFIAYSPKFVILGNNNIIRLGNNVILGPGVSFVIQGNNCHITVGCKTTMTHSVEILVQEDEMFIEIGENCMLSNTINIRTSDSHPIYSQDSNSRINPPKPVIIEDNVWVAPNTKIMKGSRIGFGSIIGTYTIVNKTIPCNCLAVGMPAKVVKEGVRWSREKMFEC